ncbi:MAG: DUF86 domain-containing protein [Planctomycetes bacterium]|nr:DUF86 domain-containing protein [Planctomycetota bacterium]
MFDMPRDDAARIQDIRESCDRITRFIAQMNFEKFRASDITVRAVLYELIVIGEASKNISDSSRAKFPGVPWKQISGMRDIVIHQYHGVMLDVIWETVTHRVANLRQMLSQ